jgi:hypothetical protein
MRSAIPRTARRSTRGRLTAAAAAPPRQAGTTLRAALRRDLSDYLTARRTAEHISAVSLRVTFAGRRPAISLADGTTRPLLLSAPAAPPAARDPPWGTK